MKPIILSAESIRLILLGEKTQTRRVIRPQPDPGILLKERPKTDPVTGWVIPGRSGQWDDDDATGRVWKCPYGAPGSHLWVKETFHAFDNGFHYRADFAGDPFDPDECGDTSPSLVGEKWKSPIYMPRRASRMTLEVTDVRVQRLQELTHADALAEGCTGDGYDLTDGVIHGPHSPATCEYAEWWDRLNAQRGFGWDTNPYVWVLHFR